MPIDYVCSNKCHIRARDLPGVFERLEIPLDGHITDAIIQADTPTELPPLPAEAPEH